MNLALEPRHWVLLVFVASALYAHFRGRVRFSLVRALLDFTVLIAPVNALIYLFSRTPRSPYLPLRDFPELKVLTDNWQQIREEALRLNDEGFIRAAAGHTDIGFNSFFRTGWKRFYLSWYGQDLESAQRLCPTTVGLLKGIPSVKAAMFASLPPGATLVRHRDPYAGSLRYHLGLATPNDPDCFIEVDGQRYHWRDGEAVMFDETYIHHAANTTQQQRVILFCDVERPLWTAPVRWFNRLFARHVMAAAATQNVPGEPVGALNRFFQGFYAARKKAKDLKARSRTTYYAGKWALILAALWALFW
ncbi:aspartyl/asparaginyl beta-hydroxylase domain-containing protein [Azohydromonas caseinilytica]|uniref:Aspartyl/asparaginyl beta-hydroxylase domain-containing protein n=1 Tax=Azohydromonas caseinilytica TaxID=2728836 RepID=A0A848F783_9BURK|nr:aspartyl/asparaginyl beta-hydroxylase domain-containing protein [Azohydromonas caseinilytica]NML14203.1 aspartyl/asparaginyl beta-hydroxylase domain-containing protein [Azohydromonas caseinilytica]